MSVEYPWILANGRIPTLLERISAAAKPERFSQEFIEKLGLTSSNDRAFIPLLRRLGFLNDSNQPTAYYDLLRDANERPGILAERIRETYSDLFAINTSIYRAADQDIKGAIARVTGKDETAVDRNFRTFKALVQQANFDKKPSLSVAVDEVPETPPKADEISNAGAKERRPTAFHYNVQIILPATTEIAVYNAIFKSLRDNLDI
ncbi:DUF5343 domain-containing protein [Bradyrhizobium sp. dw_78]|uniref:DUF5343 domain-containing protein n=1 Tax=Bradyrhizobium sp. dw_78 TaxID=2719793 RepID=UPI001BD4959B|nr:DUF5343 domain-containing protein [Bradyrhizobium sp. dw_78]